MLVQFTRKSSTRSQVVKAEHLYKLSPERHHSNHSQEKQVKIKFPEEGRCNVEYYQKQIEGIQKIIDRFTIQKKELQKQWFLADQLYEKLMKKVIEKYQVLQALKSKKRNILLQLKKRQASKQEIGQIIQPIDFQMQSEETNRQNILNHAYNAQQEIKRFNQNAKRLEARISELYTYSNELRSKISKGPHYQHLK